MGVEELDQQWQELARIHDRLAHFENATTCAVDYFCIDHAHSSVQIKN
jgi:hypothetical protein